MKKIQITKMILVCFIGVLLVSCQNDESKKGQQNAQKFVKELEAVAKIKEDIQKEDIEMKPIVFEGANLRDPFEIPSLVKSVKNHPSAILTGMALDSLKLTGIVVNHDTRFAVLRANDGVLYKITVGMRVGLQQALVSQIEQDRIVFTVESETDSNKKEMDSSRKVVMTLQEPQ